MFFSKDMLVTARSVMKWDHYLCLNCGHEEAIGPWTQRVFIMPREWLEDELDTELRY